MDLLNWKEFTLRNIYKIELTEIDVKKSSRLYDVII